MSLYFTTVTASHQTTPCVSSQSALARQVGLQMNYNKLCACVAEDAIHPNFEHSLGQVRQWCPCCAFDITSDSMVWILMKIVLAEDIA